MNKIFLKNDFATILSIEHIQFDDFTNNGYYLIYRGQGFNHHLNCFSDINEDFTKNNNFKFESERDAYLCLLNNLELIQFPENSRNFSFNQKNLNDLISYKKFLTEYEIALHNFKERYKNHFKIYKSKDKYNDDITCLKILTDSFNYDKIRETDFFRSDSYGLCIANNGKQNIIYITLKNSFKNIVTSEDLFDEIYLKIISLKHKLGTLNDQKC